jgi:hypothetical protein
MPYQTCHSCDNADVQHAHNYEVGMLTGSCLVFTSQLKPVGQMDIVKENKHTLFLENKLFC